MVMIEWLVKILFFDKKAAYQTGIFCEKFCTLECHSRSEKLYAPTPETTFQEKPV